MDALSDDLDRLVALHEPLWRSLEGAEILVTGGSGFFGAWLLHALLRAEDRLGLGVRLTVLTRRPAAFLAGSPKLAGHPAVRLLEGDLLKLRPPPARFTHVIHAAAPTADRTAVDRQAALHQALVEGAARVLEVARRCGARRLLFTSSGAVYGRQPPELTHLPEAHAPPPEPAGPGNGYATGKREAERLLLAAPGLEAVVARCFAFSGPHLPLDGPYALGNFVRDALAGGPIRVGGDGTPVRSYLYGADLAGWLWTLLADGQAGRAYNVGSEREISIAALAHLVAGVVRPPRGVEIAGVPVPGKPAERYVPSTRRAREELGLGEHWELETAVARMAAAAGRVG